MSKDIKCTSYVGQLFRGESSTRSWAHIIPGQVAVHLKQREGGAWWIVASKKEMTWEKQLEPNFKFRIKETFVQWQYPNEDGVTETIGLRVKSENIAKEFVDTVNSLLSSTGRQQTPPLQPPSPLHSRKPRHISPPAPPTSSAQPSTVGNSSSKFINKPKEVDEPVVLKVRISDKDSTSLKLSKSVLLLKVVNSVCQKKQLDPSLYVAMQQSDSAQGGMLPCQATMVVGDLKVPSVHLVLKEPSQAAGHAAKPSQAGTAPAAMSPVGGNGLGGIEDKEQLVSLQVQLPQSERDTVMLVPPTITMATLLVHICEKHGMDPSLHRFNLPVTEESLAKRVLKNLRISAIGVLRKDPPPQQAPPTQEVIQKAPPTKEVTQQVLPPKPSSEEAASSPSKLRSKRSRMKKKMSVDSSLESLPPQNGKARGAPPPPPMERRRTQPEFMSQLASKMAQRRRQEDTLEEDFEVSGVKERDGSDGLPSEDGSVGELSIESLSQGESKKELDSVTDGPPPVSILGSPLRSRGALKPRGIPAPPPPLQKQAPDAETVPTTSKQPPPPVSIKPKKKPRSYHGEDEVDFGGDLAEVREGRSSSLRQELEGAESSITAALMAQAGNRMGRPVKTKPQDKVCSDTMDTTGNLPGKVSTSSGVNSHPKNESVTGKVRSHSSATAPEPPSQPKKPKGPAPRPPPTRYNTLARMTHIQSHDDDTREDQEKQAKVNAEAQDLKTREDGENRKTGRSVSDVIPPSYATLGRGGAGGLRRPLRKAPAAPKAPSRPPPSIPEAPNDEPKTATGDATNGRKKLEEEDEKKPPATTKVGGAGPEPRNSANFERTKVPPSDLGLRDPPPPSQNSPTVSVRSIDSATTECREEVDGSKLLIIRPSPGTTRRNLASPIVFKLPPPPPPENAPGNDEHLAPPLSGVKTSTTGGGSPQAAAEPPVEEKKKKKKKKKDATAATEDKPKKKKKKVRKSSSLSEDNTRSSLSPEPSLEETMEEKDDETAKKNVSSPSPVDEDNKREIRSDKTPNKVAKPEAETPPITTSAMSGNLSDSENSCLSPIVSPGGGLLNTTIVSNEFTNLDSLLSDSTGEAVVTTDFSNLDPPTQVEQLHSNGGKRVGRRRTGERMSSGCIGSNASLSDSDSGSSQEGGFQIASMDEDNSIEQEKPLPPTHRKIVHSRTGSTHSSPGHSPRNDDARRRTTHVRSLSSQSSSPSGSPSRRRVPPPPPVTMEMMSINILLSNTNSNNNNSAESATVKIGGSLPRDSLYLPPPEFGAEERDASEEDSDSDSEPLAELLGIDEMDGGKSNCGIELLSVKKTSEGTFSTVEDAEGSAEVAYPQSLGGETGKYKMGDVTLDEMDGVVSGLREFVKEASVGEATPLQVVTTSFDEDLVDDAQEGGMASAHDLPTFPDALPPPILEDKTAVLSDSSFLSEASPIPQAPPAPEAPPIPRAPPVPEAPPIPQAPPVPKALSIPRAPPVPEAPPTPQTLPMPEAPLLPATPPPILDDDNSCETPPPPPPPSLPPPALLKTSVFSDDRGLEIPPPPPPPSSSPPRPGSPVRDDKESLPMFTETAGRKLDAPVAKKPPPLAEKPAKSRFKKAQRNSEDDESELLRKMKERRERFSKSGSSQVRSRHENEDRGSVDSDSGSKPGETGSKSDSKPGSDSSSGDMQMQLQFLQQQVIQQQMMQLQQQFQQLLAMNPGMNVSNMGMMGMGPGGPMANPMMNMQAMGGMSGGGMGMGNPNNFNVPNMGMNTNSMGMNPGGAAMSGLGNQPGTGITFQGMQNQNTLVPAQMQYGSNTNSPQVPYQPGIPPTHPMMSPATLPGQVPTYHPQQQPGISQGHVTQATSFSTPVYPVSQGDGMQAMAPPSVPPPPPLEAVETVQEKKPSDSERKRSQAMGVAEQKFDMLMDDIRDSNAHNLLRRVPLPKEVSDSPKPNSDSEDESSYTGMATALANAIRERRQHISDKRQSYGDDSLNDEWQSP